MTRNLKALGLALVAALALGAMTASGASASPALFTANVPAGQTASIDGSQVGVNTFTLNGLALTCATATANGKAITAGTSSTYVTLTPAFGTCHVVVAGLTKLVTVTTNGCGYTFNATKNTGGFKFSADLTIECPTKPIEVHVYNAAVSEATTLCTYDIGHQTVNDKIELTNEAGAPSDVLAHVNVPVTAHNTILSALCGQNTFEPAIYHGTVTLRATDEAGNFVNASVS